MSSSLVGSRRRRAGEGSLLYWSSSLIRRLAAMVFYFWLYITGSMGLLPKDCGWHIPQLSSFQTLARIDLLSRVERSLGCCRVSGKWSMINGRMCSIVCVCVVGDDYCVLVLARCLSAEGSLGNMQSIFPVLLSFFLL